MRPRRVDPIRQGGRVYGRRRAEVQERCRELDANLGALDVQLDQLARQRRRLADERRDHHRLLFPATTKKGRQAAPDGTEALVPLPHDAIWLYGRRLRAVCLGILHTRGALPLVELHAQLHRLGFGIDHPHAVKALSDALRYELDRGRAVRVERGTYGLPPGTPRANALGVELLASAPGTW